MPSTPPVPGLAQMAVVAPASTLPLDVDIKEESCGLRDSTGTVEELATSDSEEEEASSSEGESDLSSSSNFSDFEAAVEQQPLARPEESPSLDEIWVKNMKTRAVHAVRSSRSLFGEAKLADCGRKVAEQVAILKVLRI